ncbi:MAG: tetratricopeptide repeat protein [Deltaproteobacteria bacterium]|nr:tetratricopeptide repeat protein [Deltaproteobacteria bacterium]
MRLALLRCALLVVACACACAPLPARPPAKPAATVDSLRAASAKLDNAILSTKRMIERARGAAYLPDMYMRLAELYTERARHAWLIAYETRSARGETERALDVPEARLLKELAIEVYERFLADRPGHDRADEALFLLAHEHRELGNFDEMKASYERLVKEYPKSEHRLEAFLIVGDTEFDRGDLSRAEQYYQKILAEPESHVHPLARYKLAWVRINKEDCKGAARLFEQVLQDKSTPRGAKKLVATQRRLNLRREALVDLAYCYPDVYKDKPAPAHLKSLASSASDYMAALRRAASRFSIKQMYPQAALALRTLLDARPRDEDAVELARKLHDSVTKAELFSHAAKDVELIGRVYEHSIYDPRLAGDARKRLASELEVYARDIATKAHLVAKRGKSRNSLVETAAAYSAYLAYFGNARATGEIEENRAEVLLLAEDFYPAGVAFEKVAARKTTAPERQAARLSAISAYQQALDKGSLSRLERISAWAGIRAVGRAFIADAPRDPKLIQVKLAIARTHYDAGEYRRASELFHAVARQYPTEKDAIASARLALNSLLLSEDYEGIASLGKRLVADSRIGDEPFKAEVREMVARAEQRQVTELTIAAGERRDVELLSVAERHKGSGLGEQALYNALVMAREAGDVARFYQLGQEFVDTYSRSSRRTDVITALAEVAEARADYIQAAAFLEQSVKAAPGAKEAAERLLHAATIRAYLGDARASEDLRELAARGVAGTDDVLWLLSRSGNVGAVTEVISALENSPVVGFLAAQLAYQRGDLEAAQGFLAKLRGVRADGPIASEALSRARFLEGELMLRELLAPSSETDVAAVVTQKATQLAEVDKAYSQAIRSGHPTWAIAGIARLSQGYAALADLLEHVELPESLSPEEENQIRGALKSKAGEAARRAAELKKTCRERAREAMVFSEIAASCLRRQEPPEKVLVLVEPKAPPAEPQETLEVREALGKKPRDIKTLMKLAEMYLGAANPAMALLLLDRAAEVDARVSELQNLRGVALHRAGEPGAAYEAFVQAVKLDAQNTRARQNLAAHYAEFGYTDLAQAELGRASGTPTPRGEASEHPSLGMLANLNTKKGGRR